MKTLTNFINDIIIEDEFNKIDSQIVCESLECKILKDLAKQLLNLRNTQKTNIENDRKKYQDAHGGTWYPGLDKPNNQTFKNIFGSRYRTQVKWSEITDKDVTVYEPEQYDKKLEKLIRSVIKQQNDAMIITQDPETNLFEYVIFSSDGMMFQLSGDTSSNGSWYSGGNYAGKSTQVRTRGGSRDITQAEKIELTKNKRIYYIDLTGKYDDYRKLWNDRYNSKLGVIEFDPESLRVIATKNVERYKKIVAQMKAKRENADELLEKCQKVINKVADLAVKVAKDAVVNADMIEPVARMTAYIYDKREYHPADRYTKKGYYSGVNGLLPAILSYTKARQQAATSSIAADSYRKDMEAQKKILEDSLNKILDLAKQFNIEL